MPKDKQTPFSFKRKDDSFIYIIYMPHPNRPLVLRQHKKIFSVLSVHSVSQEVGSVAQEERPVLVAEISTKQI